MPDFKFVKIPNLETWIVSAPKRAKRPYVKGRSCVFCPGFEKHDPEVFRIGGADHDSDWKVRVIDNKFPFAPIHEVVILTREHARHTADIPVDEFRLGIEAYVNRYNMHRQKGSVCIFGNSGHDAGESIKHAHAQIAVVPKEVELEVSKLEHHLDYRAEHFQVGEFLITCPPYSAWPDEIWIVPQERKKEFGDISYKEIESLSYIWHRLLKIMTYRHGNKFSHNFYIYPYNDWYVRIIPRDKIAGGFEMMTGVYVNTQDPAETMRFIKEHFAEADSEKIRKNRSRYRKGV